MARRNIERVFHNQIRTAKSSLDVTLGPGKPGQSVMHVGRENVLRRAIVRGEIFVQARRRRVKRFQRSEHRRKQFVIDVYLLDCLFGGVGSDHLSGSQGDDRLLGDDGSNAIPGNDRLAGNAGNDLLVGGPGKDRLSGDAGDDRLSGGRGSNRLRGGSGNDRLNGRNSRFDRLNCGRGRDIARADRIDRVRGCEVVRPRRRRGRSGS